MFYHKVSLSEKTMAYCIDSKEPNFPAWLNAFVCNKSQFDPEIEKRVTKIIQMVREQGDEAVLEFTKMYDKIDLTANTLLVPQSDIDAAIKTIGAEDRSALTRAADRIMQYHQKQRPQNISWTDAVGIELGWRWTALDSAGLYVPGGLAAYPSSVLMNGIPARVAGVKNLVMCTPAPKGTINPLVLLAARLLDIEKIYRVGGAQAIAALAYGTETIPAVDKITGPGNTYVATAKRLVFGQTGIDMIAGPSEVVIIADAANDAEWIATDLMSQAEHDPNARAVLITDDQSLRSNVMKNFDKIVAELPFENRWIAQKSWQTNGTIIYTQNMIEAAHISNRIAPEHLQICTVDSASILAHITHAGAIFIGQWTPEAIGDYNAGGNHVLPTNSTARFASGLSVLDFMKRTTITQVKSKAFSHIGQDAARLAQLEGLKAHQRSILLRLKH